MSHGREEDLDEQIAAARSVNFNEPSHNHDCAKDPRAKRLRAEVKRLRAALRRIAAIPASVGRGFFPVSHATVVRGMREHAQAALKRKRRR